ncbi:signal recognition particle-docking protein FtsY [Oceanospirillum linum]|uniref:Signal recognition particle receptor FtsY n=1 Tax=Oceanospirillum linum TaxID=966 RepID=A0A1T1H8I3_OCELI|nr:signal recognition particle-docking protein FtsY [Oceanospirillum linum]OOV86184.1 signal recognition particle-docking protein FtsY [Oceanospirillum linum]SEG38687.1 signal recognition particle-docking protein FtsY [Oleiphilus messinensis]SMP31976.1 signal recognition particle-docking protein FtsY [Oceanospirillum linum]
MFGFFKRNKKQPEAPLEQSPETNATETEAHEAPASGELSTQTGNAQEKDASAEQPIAEADSAVDQDAPVTALSDDKPSAPGLEHPAEEAPQEAPVPSDPVTPDTVITPEPVMETPKADAPPKKEKVGFFGRIKQGLGRTRANLSEGLASLFLGKKQIDDDLLEDIETQLLIADIGVEATSEIIDRLTERVSRKQLTDAQALYEALQEELRTMLEPSNKPLVIGEQTTPYVILMVGVNGVGKTTTIGKLAKKFQSEGKSVMLAAGDTFRAAAVEQLQVWGERNSVPVIAQHTGADSASVIFDAIQAAQARNIDVLIADTAGRLQNKSNLMEELKKVTRVMKKLDGAAPHETMLVVDAGTGQNALSQASLFDEAVGLTGITLTKLDGTAKGGIVFALAQQMQIPIRFIGVGEQVDDLRPFDADQFTKALFDKNEG